MLRTYLHTMINWAQTLRQAKVARLATLLFVLVGAGFSSTVAIAEQATAEAAEGAALQRVDAALRASTAEQAVELALKKCWR